MSKTNLWKRKKKWKIQPERARERQRGGKNHFYSKKKRKLKKGSQFVCYFVSFFDPHRQIWLKHKPWDIFGGNINPDIGRHSTTAKVILHRMNIFEPKKKHTETQGVNDTMIWHMPFNKFHKCSDFLTRFWIVFGLYLLIQLLNFFFEFMLVLKCFRFTHFYPDSRK